MDKYSIVEFNKNYPNDDVCLDEIFANRYGHVTTCPKCGVIDTKFYRVKTRKCYACMHCGYQLHPLAGTIFHKSETPLTKWFFAIYLFSQSKNGVSAKELERHLKVTYKTAWRIAKHVRMLMSQAEDKLDGTVEADETYIGGKRRGQAHRWDNKTPVIGLVERGGQTRAIVADANASVVLPFITANLEATAELHTDDSKIYSRVSRSRVHSVINHSKGEYARGNISTNTIEGFWGQMKRSLDGTYHSVSPKHLQLYVNEFVYRYNHRNVPIYPLLMVAAAKRV